MVAVDVVLATPAVEARRAGALVHVPLAVLPRVARRTLAAVPVHQVLAGSSILALILAVVYIGVTVLPRPTRDALAEVSTNQVAAGVGVDTGLTVTFIGVNQAGLSHPLGGAETLVAID